MTENNPIESNDVTASDKQVFSLDFNYLYGKPKSNGVFKQSCADFNVVEDLGFELLSPGVLNTADYGVPQTRRRAIAIGVRSSSFRQALLPKFPPPSTHASPDIDADLPKWPTVREFISDLPRPKGKGALHMTIYQI